MNKVLAQYALAHYKDPSMPKKNGLCQKEARMLIQGALGHQFDGALVRPSAKEAAESLLRAGLAFPASELAKHGGLQEGDVCYKTEGSGGFGHVGIYTLKGIVENSTYHWRKTGSKDARGIRTLAQFGAFQVVARFPVPATAQKPVTATPLPLKPVVAHEPKPLTLYWNGNDFPFEKLFERQGHHVDKITWMLDGDMKRVWVNTTPGGGDK